MQATEYGFSIARDYTLYDRRVSIGVKPKLVDLRAFTFRESILTVNAGYESIDDKDQRLDLGSFFTIDLGLAADVYDYWVVGLNFRNLIPADFDINGQILDFDTEAALGIAYNHPLFTVALDYDLNENEPFLANRNFDALTTQFIALGAEIRPTRFASLRVGVAKNIVDGISSDAREPQYTIGLGLWIGFNLDIAVIANDNSLGAVLQTGFRF